MYAYNVCIHVYVYMYVCFRTYIYVYTCLVFTFVYAAPEALGKFHFFKLNPKT